MAVLCAALAQTSITAPVRAEPSELDCAGESSLHRAVLAADTAELARLVAAGASAIGVNARGDTALHLAARLGDLASLRVLVGPATLELTDRTGSTPLLRAALAGREAAALALLDAGAKAAVVNDAELTPLMAASRRGSSRLVTRLLANPEVKEGLDGTSEDGLSALDHAVLAGSRQVVLQLVAAGASPSPSTLVNGCAVARPALVRWLATQVHRGAAAVQAGLDAAMLVAVDGDAAGASGTTVACLVDAGAMPSVEAFVRALSVGREDLAVLLVLRGLVPSADAQRKEPLLHAAIRGLRASSSPAARRVPVIDLLLALAASLEARDAEGRTALHAAILGRDAAIVTHLLAAGDSGRALLGEVTPLELALETGDRALVAPIAAKVGAGIFGAVALDDVSGLDASLDADPATLARPGPDGLAPLHVAARFGAIRALARLVARGALLDAEVGPARRPGAIDTADHAGWTALHFAAAAGRAEAFRWLVERGALDRPAKDGKTATQRATWKISDASQGVGPDDLEALPERDRPSPPIEKSADSPGSIGSSADRGEGGDVQGAAASRSSFIELGGGWLRVPAVPDEAVVPRSRLAPGSDLEGPAHGLEAALARCMERRRWPEAERAARLLLVERMVPPSPIEAGGAGVWGGALLRASAKHSLARALLERGRLAEAEATLTSAAAELGWKAARGAEDQAIRVPIGLARVRAAELRGRTDLAELALRATVEEASSELRPILLGRLGVLLGEAARYGDAIASHREALWALALAGPMRSVAAAGLRELLTQNLGTLLARVGEKRQSSTIWAAAWERVVRGMVPDPEERALIRFASGLIAYASGVRDEGEGRIATALGELAAVAPRHPALARMALALATMKTDLRRFDEARQLLAKAEAYLRLAAPEDRSGSAPENETLLLAGAVGGAADLARIGIARARIERLAGQLELAFAMASTAYVDALGSGSLEARWPVELELARIESARGRRASSIWFGKRALTTLAEIGQSVPEELRRGFVEDRIDAWRAVADHLVAAGRFLEATAAVAGLKDDEAESVAATRGKKAARPAAAPTLPVLAPERTPAPDKPLVQAQREVDKLEAKASIDGLTVPDRSRLDALRDKLRERRKAFEAWLARLEEQLETLTPARARAIAAMNLRDLAGLQGTLEGLGPGVVLVHYLLTEDRLRIIVTTPTTQVGRDVEIPMADLNALIFQFREVLKDARRDVRPVAAELYKVLVAPIRADLDEAKAQTLLVSLDGALRYAPLVALWDGKGWLVESYRIALFSRTALDKLATRRPGAESLAAFGCGRQVDGFEPLFEVPSELEGIVKRDDADPDGVVPGVVRLDDAFSRQSFTELLEARHYNAIHIASHFVLAPGGESDSYLLLGDGQRMTLEDMRYDLRFDGVDLLSLSACNTAVGGQNDGREVEGFASLALRLGARAVLATLWPVNDRSTGAYMRLLYRLVEEDPKRSRADAMRLAMLAFIRGEVGAPAAVSDRGARPLGLAAEGSGTAKLGLSAAAGLAVPEAPPQADMKHPHYWAPFVLMGGLR
ncbi:MAG: CHAT domain-containing protein [Deltaproteobacteria bacterium]|nr:CHAT domain-containing protein [Deltaproteobacteria bacterium]